MIHWKSLRAVVAACAALFANGCQSMLKEPDVTLTVNGKTDYVVVKPTNPTEVDDYAVTELAHYLGEITGATFPVVEPDDVTENQRAVFVGVSDPMKERLGDDEPLSVLKNEEHICRTRDGDVFLYGDPPHGNKDAVFAFLEDVGWRWFSVFEHPVVPSKQTLVLKPFNKKMGFDVPYRMVSVSRNMDFPYQHGANMGFDSRKRKIAWRHGKDAVKELSPFVPETKTASAGHTLFRYIPPKDAKDHYDFNWLKKDNYFKTNPEFFTMSENGERVANKQLCFASRGLRDELTKNILKHIELAGGADREVIVGVGANDSTGTFCHCPECLKLEEKHGGPGGPIYDYLLELCPIVKEKFPKAKIITFAYRRSQTQDPPKLPEGERLPDNLIIDFAPIDDNYFADWTHPDPQIQDTYDDLKKWCELSDNVWCWIYPNPWGTGAVMPVGNVERLITNVRLMKDLGVKRVFADHNGQHQRAGFSELQNYLLLKLLKDADQDETVLIKEFTDSLYGPAAPLMRKYLKELEQCRQEMTELPPGLRYKSGNFDDLTFPYLTAKNIHRWQTYFDEMEKLLEGQPKRYLNNVRYARRELDLATLWQWFDLKEKFPDYYQNHEEFVKRIQKTNDAKPEPWMNDGHNNRTEWEKKSEKSINRGTQPLGTSAIRDFSLVIKAGGKEKPLPPEFNDIDPKRVKTFVPEFSRRMAGRLGVKPVVLDPDAAYGYAAPVYKAPGLPFPVQFFHLNPKKRNAQLRIKKNQITPGVYKTYKLGTIEVTPNSRLWFRWGTTGLDIGKRLYEPGEDNLWDCYVSLKFEGPTYGGGVNEKLVSLKDRAKLKGADPKDLILADRIILIRKGRQ